MSIPSPLTRDGFIQAQNAIVQAAEEKAAQCQHTKKKLAARERLSLFFDDGVRHGVGQSIGGSVREGRIGSAVAAGSGRVQGRMVAACAQDLSVFGGTPDKVEGDKIIGLIDRSIRMRTPVAGIQDSGGVRIQEGVVALAQYGRAFKKMCEASGLVPQISIILGPCAGGVIYQPALTGFIAMTRENSHMFVTGPDVIAAATGEKVVLNELGDASIHNFRSGVAHHMADTEEEMIDYVRSLLDYPPFSCEVAPPKYEYIPNPKDEAAACAVADLVPMSACQPYDVRDVVCSLVDHGEHVETQDLSAPNVTIGSARADGQSVDIVANQPMNDAGTLNVDASKEAARFVRFCDAFGPPIVIFVDVLGYHPGTEQEQTGIIRRGTKVIVAYANATVPMMTVIPRKAYGGIYIVIGPKSIGADLALAWPNAQIVVMGAEGATSTTYRRELTTTRENETFEETKAEFVARYEKETVNPEISVPPGQLDGIIAPADTRQIIIDSLHLLATKDQRAPHVRRHDNGPL